VAAWLALCLAGCATDGYGRLFDQPAIGPKSPVAAPNAPPPSVVQARFDAGQTVAGQQAAAPVNAARQAKLAQPVELKETGLTLDQAIHAALLANAKIRAGVENITQARADYLTSSLLPNPTLTADLLNLPLTHPFTVDVSGGPPQTDYMVSYPIDWFLFGKRAASMASAQAGVRVSEADYADLVRTKVLEVASSYYDVVEAKALLDLARQDVENLRRVEASIKKAAELGGRPAVDLKRASLEVLKAEQDVREAETKLVTARASLRALLGRRDADALFDVAASLDTPVTARPLPLEESLTLAEKNRPDIASLRLLVDKASRDVHSEMTKAYPAVTPQLGYTRQFQQKAIGFPDADSWLMAVSITLPFSDRNQGNIAKAKSVFAQNNVNLEGGLTDLRAELAQVVQEFDAAYRSAGAVGEQQVKLARDVRDSIEKGYKEGGRTLIEFLDAEREYRDTYRTYISNRAAYWRALYRYSAAVGQQVLHHDKPPE
jgi:cobalt-zinc-cadmium efflux system outer membrane protein